MEGDRDEQEQWLAKLEAHKESLRSFVTDAVAAGQDPIMEAMSDMLEELNQEYLESFQAGYLERRYGAVRAYPEWARSLMQWVERRTHRTANRLDWYSARIRVRLGMGRP